MAFPSTHASAHANVEKSPYGGKALYYRGLPVMLPDGFPETRAARSAGNDNRDDLGNHRFGLRSRNGSGLLPAPNRVIFEHCGLAAEVVRSAPYWPVSNTISDVGCETRAMSCCAYAKCVLRTGYRVVKSGSSHFAPLSCAGFALGEGIGFPDRFS